MYREGDNGFFYVGRDFYRDRPLCIAIGIGRIDNPKRGERRFRHIFEWSPRTPIKIYRGGLHWWIEYGFGYSRRIRQLKWQNPH